MLVFFKDLTTLLCGSDLSPLPFLSSFSISPFLLLLTKDTFAFSLAVPSPAVLSPSFQVCQFS